MPYAIETINLTKHFTPTTGLRSFLTHPLRKKGAVGAVEEVSIQVKRGEIFGLLGPNGAGKTTLLKLLSCLILPTKGTAYINGYHIIKDEQKVKSSIGLVTGEERSFYWRLTGKRNLEFFATLYNLSRDQAKMRIKELLNLLEIEEPDKRFQEYSTGVKQRMALARCLLNDPSILLMDEPTKSLDPLAAKNLRTFIKKELVKRQKKTLLFTTHHLDEVIDFCDQIAIMDRGRIKAWGNLSELQKQVSIPEATLEEIFSKLVTKKET